MKKKEFDELFIKAKKQFLPQTEEEILERLSQYAKDTNRMTLEEMASAIWSESIKYTNDLVYSLLLATVVEEA